MAWWHTATAYQIYPRSFQDSNGDGFGDIPGIIRRLPYLHELGIQLIWLTPMYPSPGYDNGYDISDYQAIDPRYGTLADFRALLTAAHQYNIRIMMDLVLNHTSSEHPWFRASRQDKTNPYADFYFWTDTPTNWVSRFSGSTWQWDDTRQQYYLHIFEQHMPDLNWGNPMVRKKLLAMMAWWAEQGIDGFRLDVINMIAKRLPFGNVSRATPQDDGRAYYINGPRVHDYLRQMNDQVFGPHRMITVGELASAGVAETGAFTDPAHHELAMAFSFEHLKIDYTNGQKWTLGQFSLPALKAALTKWQVGIAQAHGWNALFWTNHDQPRAISRFLNDDRYRTESQKLLAIVQFGLQGTPYIYQGEEIGMRNAYFTAIDQYDDRESRNAYAAMLAAGTDTATALAILQQKSRDNARTPMQWDDTVHHGFSTGTPWLAPGLPDPVTVQGALADPHSIFALYQHLISIRPQYAVFADGTFTMLAPDDTTVMHYQRENAATVLSVWANWSGTRQSRRAADLADAAILAHNYPDGLQLTQALLTLRPYEAVMVLRSK
ncbi:alpha,alpha-phosphotrehalase [Schleiferilactobacillus shenzhenensis]|uniref:TreA n=1 Tax=Schleiferilactobacillus shenzhenensis LY-73 TaxID=1231336 RepID=U4TN16_9LACO|nr:alpha,alpha-phosphotrehalase [Schleiferilactobacillus shenzhenensis]ERL65619.1 TreA [Schleiferilactobacillus shenzhenensis LY-73]